jgi:ectoine hydroxylase-related dioxygenase (phytanoyl-CoA dioxygenase family)
MTEMRATFHRDGFVRIPRFFEVEFMNAVEQAVARYVETIVPGLPPARVFRETGSSAIKSMSAMDREDAFFAALKTHPRFIALAQELLDVPDIVAENMQYFGKAAREGSAAPWHQDNGFQHYTPPDACMFWLALDDVSIENGCVRFAQGSHKLGLQPHRPSGVLGFSMGAETPDLTRFPEFPCVMPRGSISVHHCNTYHCSGPNRTDRSRRSIAINFRSERAVIDAEARARVKREAARLLEQNL